MPQMRKLSVEEVQAIQNKGKSQRKLIEQEYDTILSDYNLGDFGEADLEDSDNRLTVRNRIKAAAGRRNLGVEFRRSNTNLLRFQIIEPSTNGNAAPKRTRNEVTPPAEPVKRKGGRPKKAIERLGEIADKVQDVAKGALEDIGLREPVKRKGGRPKKSAT